MKYENPIYAKDCERMTDDEIMQSDMFKIDNIKRIFMEKQKTHSRYKGMKNIHLPEMVKVQLSVSAALAGTDLKNFIEFILLNISTDEKAKQSFITKFRKHGTQK